MKYLLIFFLLLGCTTTAAYEPERLQRILTVLEDAAEESDWCAPCEFQVMISDVPGLMAQLDRDTQVIMITPDMLRYLKTDSELAFVIAHEIGHILLLESGTMTRFQLELVADSSAVELIGNAGFDAWAGIEVLRRLDELFGGMATQGYPSFAHRIETAEALAIILKGQKSITEVGGEDK